MWKASRKSQNEAKRSSQPAACQANDLAQVAARVAQDRDALLEVLPERLDPPREDGDQDDERDREHGEREAAAAAGCAAQNEISNAGSSGSRGAAGSRPWVIA